MFKKLLLGFALLLLFNSSDATALYQGCCSHHQGLSYCHSQNVIMCADGSQSPSCSCNFKLELKKVEDLFKYNNETLPAIIKQKEANAIEDIEDIYANDISRARAMVAQYGNTQARQNLENWLTKKDKDIKRVNDITKNELENLTIENNDVLNIYIKMLESETSKKECASNSTLTESNECVCDQGFIFDPIKETCLSTKIEDESNIQQVITPKTAKPIFSDIKNIDTIEYEAAIALKDKRIIEGNPDGTFMGDNPVNRAELAKMLLIALEGEVKNPNTTTEYSDVFPDNWFYNYVSRATELGIVNGDPSGSFRPGDNVNRVEFLKMLSLTFDLSEDSEHGFTDTTANAWYEKYLGNVKKYELFPHETRKVWFYPSKAVTRYEAAVAIYTILKNQ